MFFCFVQKKVFKILFVLGKKYIASRCWLCSFIHRSGDKQIYIQQMVRRWGHYGHNLWKSFRSLKSSLENYLGSLSLSRDWMTNGLWFLFAVGPAWLLLLLLLGVTSTTSVTAVSTATTANSIRYSYYRSGTVVHYYTAFCERPACAKNISRP